MTINKNFWAKKQDNNGSFEWLPLYVHLIDTKKFIPHTRGRSNVKKDANIT